MTTEVPSELIVIAIVVVGIGLYLAWLCRAEWPKQGLLAWWRPVEDVITQILILGMLATSSLQVVARYALAEEISVPWTDEFSRLILIWGALWGAATVHRLDDHINMCILYDRLPARAQVAVRLFGDLVTLGVLAPVVWLGWQDARSLQIMSTISLGMSLSVFAYSVPVIGALMIVHTLHVMVARVRGQPDARAIEPIA
ncbi:MAG TPA: TRAP transporter small permease [Candidatus Sulfotelmatobacter sp.]|nr:TRAP transporter small permease [Candidatus Sulfotelmatobacter sp.]